jgi:hypothetical protein
VYFITNFLNAITMPIRSIYSWIVCYIPGVKNLPNVSLQMRIALMTLLFLIIVYIAAIVSYYYSLQSAQRQYTEFLIAFALILVIPVIVYYIIKYWMIKEESRYPDIDRIWTGGIAECERQGIDINNVPLFLVQGARDHRQAVQLMKASQLAFNVTFPAKEESDLLFFANSDAVYLFINGCSCLSRLSSAPSGVTLDQLKPLTAGSGVTGTIDASMFAAAAGGGEAARAPATDNVSQTLTEGAFPSASPALQPASQAAGGTILLTDWDSGGGRGQPASTEIPRSPQLTSTDIEERGQKLRYVCGLITKHRQTLCPINGLITAIPFELIEGASSQLQVAAQKDLAILRQELLVRCSNTILITQMDKDEGFQELIKRVGEERSRDFRFGKGCELWNAPEGARLDAIAAHAVGAFEDWIYMLFQEDGALKHRYNSRLFMLLCRIRGRFGENLRAVLARGFGFDPQTESHLAYEQFLFGGCYFAATGNDPGRQAFVKSVFLKGIQQEGELEWAPEARRRDRQLQFAANLFALVGMLSFLAIVGMLIWKFLPGGESS